MTDKDIYKRATAALRARPQLLALLAGEAPRERISGPDEAHGIVLPFFAGQECECVVAVAVDQRQRVIDIEVLFKGSHRLTVLDPATVYRWALTRERVASGVLVAHNHPTGDPTPSQMDKDVTRRLAEAGRAIGVDLIDHLVVGSGGYTSLAEEGVITQLRTNWRNSHLT